MYKLTHFSFLATAALLFFSISAYGYTAPEGGTLDIRLSSSPSALDSTFDTAEVTIATVSIGSVLKKTDRETFRRWPNMLNKDVTVDLMSRDQHVGTLPSSAQVLHGDFNHVHVEVADTALLSYKDSDGNAVKNRLAMTNAEQGRVVIEFDPILLKGGDERAVLSLQFDLGQSFL